MNEKDRTKIKNLLSQLEDSLDDDSIYGYHWYFVELRKLLEKPEQTKTVPEFITIDVPFLYPQNNVPDFMIPTTVCCHP